MNRPPFPPYIVLLTGIVAVSFAAIFIKMSTAHPAVIAFYRMGIATILLAPIVLWKNREEFRRLTRGQVGLAFLSGCFLALHFLFWISSFAHTSVASSVVFVTTQPIFVALASALLLKERPGLFLLIGISLACIGSLVIGAGDLMTSSMTLYGDLLALGGSIMAVGYFLLGRHLRQKISLRVYIFTVYGFCSLILLAFIAMYRLPLTGYDTVTWFSMAMLALIPTMIGHTSFNWALKYMHASVVSASALGEPVGATLLAWLILQEKPAALTLIGGLFILIGIYLTTVKSERIDDSLEEKKFSEV